MNMDNLDAIIKQLSSAGEIKITDIPDIDLYMDQVTTFMDNKLGKEKRDKKDKLLTKTMINNYSKAKILTPSKNKKYNKKQMIQLVLIYYLKQVLSISDIQDLFKPLFEMDNKHDMFIDEVYDIFLQIKRKSMDNVADMLDDMSALIDQSAFGNNENGEQDVQMLLTALMLSAQAHACKRTAEAIIDNYLKTNT